MSKNQGHTIEEHAFQLDYFIKRIVDNDAWMTACRMLEDLLAYPTKDGVAEIWEYVDAQEKGRSRDEVAKKPRIERKTRKVYQKKRYPRAPARLAAPSATEQHLLVAAVADTARQALVAAALIGTGVAPVKFPRRQKKVDDGPRVYGDKRDAGETRAWKVKKEFERYGAPKKHRGNRELAE